MMQETIADDRTKVPVFGLIVTWTSFVVVVASWFGPMYGVRRGPLVDYGGDFFGAILLYTCIRQLMKGPRIVASAGPLATATFVFVGCTAVEFAQRFGWLPGKFDPLDIANYAAGVLLCLALDRRITPPIRRA